MMAYLSPVLPVIGLLALYVWGEPVVRFLRGERARRNGGGHGTEAELLRRFVDAMEKNAEANMEIAAALKDNGHKIEAMTAQVNRVSAELEKFARQVHDAIAEVHRRVDDLILAAAKKL